ncbi:hypothetical protein D3C86_1235620 [compost metagenome]
MRNAIAGNVVKSIGFRDIFGGLADDNTELDFPVGLLRTARNGDVVIRTDDGRGRLHENDRFRRYGGTRFGGMVGEIKADADEFSGSRNAGADAVFVQDWKRAQIDRGDLFEALGRNGVAADIFHMGRQIADFSFRVEDCRFFLAGLANTHQFHGTLSRLSDKVMHI